MALLHVALGALASQLLPAPAAAATISSAGGALRGALQLQRSAALGDDNGSGRSCTPLKAEDGGTFYSVLVQVGTPPQEFSVVADTGSNSAIIPSCVCNDDGHCDAEDTCFRGSNKSSTFHMPHSENGEVASLVLTFGSGQVQAVVAQDVLKVGKASTFMEDGILLMVNKALEVKNFGGILGLGVPQNSSSAQTVEQFASPKSFLEQLGTKRFSMCYAKDGGALDLNSPPLVDSLPSIGLDHWSLDLRNVVVDEKKAIDVSRYCDTSQRKEGQFAACSAIPDSGTSHIVGPKKQVLALMEDICDEWSRCRDNHTKLQKAADAAAAAASQVYGSNPWAIQVVNKSELFMNLLMDCSTWMNEDGASIDEIPSLHFDVAGEEGVHQKIHISSSSYIVEMEEKEVEYIYRNIRGLGKVPIGVKPTGSTRTVCAPLLSDMDFPSKETGQTWILGVPLFLEYNVGYDLQERRISLSPLQDDAGCGCTNSDLALVDGKAEQSKSAGAASKQKALRRITGPFRVPDFAELRQP
eukprot:TRINITY_DN30869_c0_g1_i1.p1 TRINITY_DN30869_c0_g1~~TRINITY_DN30869_c0_g1_i1.p1  ORF type:complete len:525 (+),score=117.14 TRINITY_DN30869_c0_g1_i1:77-1651(+)